jgi:hypothetical protein
VQLGETHTLLLALHIALTVRHEIMYSNAHPVHGKLVLALQVSQLDWHTKLTAQGRKQSTLLAGVATSVHIYIFCVLHENCDNV